MLAPHGYSKGEKTGICVLFYSPRDGNRGLWRSTLSYIFRCHKVMFQCQLERNEMMLFKSHGGASVY